MVSEPLGSRDQVDGQERWRDEYLRRVWGGDGAVGAISHAVKGKLPHLGNVDGGILGLTWFVVGNQREKCPEEEGSSCSFGNFRSCSREDDVHYWCKKMAKVNWDIIKSCNLNMDRVIQSKIQGLKHEYKNLTMCMNEAVVDFAMKFTKIVSKFWNLGEMLEEKDVVCRFLQVMPAKFNALTLSLEQYGDLAKTTLDEVISSLSVHQLWLKEWKSWEEEQALLAKALSKVKFLSEESSSHRRGRNHGRSRGRGRGCGCGRCPPLDDTKKHYDKLQI